MVCKNCGYNNRDGVDFCRHCGVSLKVKSRRRARPGPTAVKVERHAQIYGDFLNTRNAEMPPHTQEDEEERLPRGGGSFSSAAAAIGIFVIACFIVFFVFAFDILKLPGSGGSITVDSSAVSSETPSAEPTAAFTPVPTIAPTVRD